MNNGYFLLKNIAIALSVTVIFTCENRKATPGLNMVVSGTPDQINPRKFYSYCQLDDLANKY